MENQEIIRVTQIPVIEEQLKVIKEQVTAKVNEALSLVCTESTLQTVKEARAELNKAFKEFEERRKAVKKEIITPYEQFEAVYKDCISDSFKNADSELKAKIDSVEKELKAEKAKKAERYFEEYRLLKGIDFVTYDNAKINVTLSASLKSLKEQVKSFIDKIDDDLKLIATQEHKDEILYEYKQSLNVSGAITTVVNRYKAIEEAKAKDEERKQAEQKKAETVAKVERAEQEVLAPPTESPVTDEHIYKATFTVSGTKAQLKALKDFLVKGGYEYA